MKSTKLKREQRYHEDGYQMLLEPKIRNKDCQDKFWAYQSDCTHAIKVFESLYSRRLTAKSFSQNQSDS
jgi:hypothetical protein